MAKFYRGRLPASEHTRKELRLKVLQPVDKERLWEKTEYGKI